MATLLVVDRSKAKARYVQELIFGHLVEVATNRREFRQKLRTQEFDGVVVTTRQLRWLLKPYRALPRDQRPLVFAIERPGLRKKGRFLKPFAVITAGWPPDFILLNFELNSQLLRVWLMIGQSESPPVPDFCLPTWRLVALIGGWKRFQAAIDWSFCVHQANYQHALRVIYKLDTLTPAELLGRRTEHYPEPDNCLQCLLLHAIPPKRLETFQHIV